MSVSLTVIGRPAPQGSKTFLGTSRAGRPIMRESSRGVAPWREAVAFHAHRTLIRDCDGPFTGPVAVRVNFAWPRPKRAFRDPHEWPVTYPDTDKLLRSTLDALVMGGLIRDDSIAVSVEGVKRYTRLATCPDVINGQDCDYCNATLDEPGAHITVAEVS